MQTRKLLLLLVGVLTSIGMWADVPDGATAFGENGSYYEVSGNVATVYMAKSGDIGSSLYSNYAYPDALQSAKKIIIKTPSGVSFSQADADSFWAFKNAECIDLSGSDITSLKSNGYIQAPESLPVFLFASAADGAAVWEKGSSYWGQRWSAYGTNNGTTLDLYVVANTTQDGLGSSSMLSANVVGDASNIVMQNANANSNLVLNAQLRNSINNARNNDSTNRIAKLTVVKGQLPQYADWVYSNTWIHNLDLSGFDANNNKITFNSGGESGTTHITSVNLSNATNLSTIDLSNQSELTDVGLGGVTSIGELNLTGVNLDNLTITADSGDVIEKIIPEKDSDGNTIDYTQHIQTGNAGGYTHTCGDCYFTIDDETKVVTVHAVHAGHFKELYKTYISAFKIDNAAKTGYVVRFDSDSKINADDLTILMNNGESGLYGGTYYVDLFDIVTDEATSHYQTGEITKAIEWLRENDKSFLGLILPKDHTIWGAGTTLIKDGKGTYTTIPTSAEFIAYYKTKDENSQDLDQQLLVAHVYDTYNSMANYSANLTKLLTLLDAHEEVYKNADIYQISTNSEKQIDLSSIYTKSQTEGKPALIETYNNEMVKDTQTKATVYVYPAKAGDLATSVAATGVNNTDVERLVVVGEMNESDYAAINSFGGEGHKGPRVLDLSKVTSDITADLLKKLSNPQVEYVVLPANVDKYKDLVLNSSAYASLSGLKAVVMETTTLDSDKAVTNANNELVANVFQAGSLYEARCHAMGIDIHTDDKYWLPDKETKLVRVTLAGQLNASDIASNLDAKYKLNSDGHFYVAADADDKDSNGQKALQYDQTNLKYMDLSHAVFARQTDMNFSAAGNTSLTELHLPTAEAMDNIPASCLANLTALSKICIPYNYKYICSSALSLCGATEISTTDAAGNEITNGDHTITIGTQVSKIETGAFHTRDNFTTDVYVMNPEAPLCERDAFKAEAYVLNNTFQGVSAHPFARDKYVVADKGAMALLHFPSNVTDAQARKFTDLDRDYSLTDETGKVDGLGNPIAWPSQTEYLRSYNQAVTGVTWSAWDDTRDPQNELNKWGTYNKATPDEGTTPAYDTQYMGWHQFALAASWMYIPSVEEEEPEEDTYTDYTKTGWYTFCIPFNMSKKQVIELLGVPKSDGKKHRTLDGTAVDEESLMPDIRTLVGVTRYPDTKIVLHFSQNLAEKAQDLQVNLRDQTSIDRATISGVSESESDNDDNKVYLRGGYPYLVNAYVPASLKDQQSQVSLGAFTLMRTSFDDANVGNRYTASTKTGDTTIAEALQAPYEQEVQAYNVANEGTASESRTWLKKDGSADTNDARDDDDYIYTFVGQYWNQPLPLYSYYLGNGDMFYRATAKSTTDPTMSKWAWKPYVAIIIAKNETSVTQPIKTTGNGYSQALEMKFGGGDDSFSVKGSNLLVLFDDGIEEIGADGNDVTAIDRLNGEDLVPASAKVYNLNGQCVGTSIEGLAKGLYIVNGKKYLVK